MKKYIGAIAFYIFGLIFLLGAGWLINPYQFTSAAFDPLDLSPELLLDTTDSGDITLNGSDVSQWDDLSGNGNHAVQATASEQPFYNTTGTNKIDCDGVDESLETGLFSTSITQPGTLVTVATWTGSGNEHLIDVDTVITNRWIFLALTSVFTMHAGADVTGAATDTNTNIHIAEYNGASSKLYLNGGTPSTGNPSTNTYDSMVICNNFQRSAEWTGDVYFIMLTDDILTDQEKNDLGAYLEGRFPTEAWTDV